MDKNLDDLKGVSVSDLKKIFRDYNQKLQKKKYKMGDLKKGNIYDELKKMYKWKKDKEKISFLRKGKQHSFILNLKGSAKRQAEDKAKKEKSDKRKKLQAKRRKAKLKQKIKKAEITKRVYKAGR